MTARTRTLAVAAAAAVLLLAAGLRVSAQSPADADARIWSGVYSTAQAARGRTVYEAYCTRCHGLGLAGGRQGAGGGPALAGDALWLNWERRTLADLYSKISRTMPLDSPGSLRLDDYSDLLAYILEGNRFPAGSVELHAKGEGLGDIRIARRQGDVVAAPNFALVQTVGCLASSGSGWTLTQGTSPVVTREEVPTPNALKDAENRALGTETLALSSVAPFQPDANRGRRVEVRGLLNRTEREARLDVLSLQAVGGACGG